MTPRLRAYLILSRDQYREWAKEYKEKADMLDSMISEEEAENEGA